MSDRPWIVVIGLGPAGPELITAAALAAWDGVAPERRFTRTDRHPSVAALGSHRSFDSHYDVATGLDSVYPSIVEELVALATEHAPAGNIVYAVPGSPFVAERTVELLRADSRVQVVIEPALSFLDLVWARLGVDPLAAGVRLIDGQRFGTEAAGERGPLLVAQCDNRDVLSDVKLSFDPWPDEPVVVLARLGLAEESVTVVAWEDLDRVVEPDHLTSLWIPSLAAPVAAELAALGDLVGRLRRECPWDRSQTHHSLARYVLEEAYEVVETLENLDLESGDGAEELADELGDLLFQVYLHSEIAAQAGWFTLADVAQGIHDKMVRRHPHIFGVEQGSLAPHRALDLGSQWDEIKQAERNARGEGPLDGLAQALPALTYAAKLQRKVASLGLGQITSEQAWFDLHECAEGPLMAAEHSERVTHLGDLLFAVCRVAGEFGVDPEEALRRASQRERAKVMSLLEPG